MRKQGSESTFKKNYFLFYFFNFGYFAKFIIIKKTKIFVEGRWRMEIERMRRGKFQINDFIYIY